MAKFNLIIILLHGQTIHIPHSIKIIFQLFSQVEKGSKTEYRQRTESKLPFDQRLGHVCEFSSITKHVVFLTFSYLIEPFVFYFVSYFLKKKRNTQNSTTDVVNLNIQHMVTHK